MINSQSRRRTIAVIGIGKLGLCLALNLERSGYKVIGIDTDAGYCDRITHKTFTSSEPDLNTYLHQSRDFYATTDMSVLTGISTHPIRLAAPAGTENVPSVPSVKDKITNVFEEPDVIFIAVATPTLPGRSEYDHTQIDTVLSAIAALPRPTHRKFIYIVCTTMPGYCDSIAFPNISPSTGVPGYSISYTPQFIAQGTILRNQKYPDQLLIGEADTESGEVVLDIYNDMVESKPTVCRMSRISAEITKLATNCFLTTKIAFANAIGDLATAAGAEPDKILQAIGSDSRIGSKCLGYGYGFGGPCFPRDNRALQAFARSKNQILHLSEATDESNRYHLDYQFLQLHAGHAAGMVPQPMQGGFVFDSVTYKPASVLIEESQQLLLAVRLARSGHNVLIRERKEVVEAVQKLFGELFQYEIRT